MNVKTVPANTAPIIPWWNREDAPWWLRYPAGIALFVGAFYLEDLLGAGHPSALWLVRAGLVLTGIVLLREAVLWALAALIVTGVLTAIGAGIAALPVSVAIILGALIISGGSK